MRLVLLGVRGSTPSPGAEYLRYGGHTSCVAVIGDGERVPSLLLDAGTGVRGLPALLGGAPFRGAVVLTHLHWDHVQGLPFCPSIDRPDASVELHVPGAWGPQDGPAEAGRLLERAMSPPHFPISPAGLKGRWIVRAARPGPIPVAGGRVILAPVRHKGGTTFGVRVDLDGTGVAYLPDHAGPHRATGDWGRTPSLEVLLAGVDVLVHDGQYLAHERAVAVDYGHAVIDDVLRLADRYDVGQVILTHHAPGRTDAELDALAAAVSATPQGRPVRVARQGQVVQVEPRPPGAGHPGLARVSEK